MFSAEDGLLHVGIDLIDISAAIDSLLDGLKVRADVFDVAAEFIVTLADLQDSRRHQDEVIGRCSKKESTVPSPPSRRHAVLRCKFGGGKEQQLGSHLIVS